MPWQKPRFELNQLIILVAVVAIELGTLRTPLSWVFAGMGIISAVLASALRPMSKIEWCGIGSIHILIYGLLSPWADSLHRQK